MAFGFFHFKQKHNINKADDCSPKTLTLIEKNDKSFPLKESYVNEKQKDPQATPE